jgi:hypothetical protein
LATERTGCECIPLNKNTYNLDSVEIYLYTHHQLKQPVDEWCGSTGTLLPELADVRNRVRDIVRIVSIDLVMRVGMEANSNNSSQIIQLLTLLLSQLWILMSFRM